MDRKIRSNGDPAIYALPKIIAEPMVGRIKAPRGLDRSLTSHRAALNTA
jgi:hypothetical protein